jgi:hypothetical protein
MIVLPATVPFLPELPSSPPFPPAPPTTVKVTLKTPEGIWIVLPEPPTEAVEVPVTALA